jgi:hypothetical protein
MAERVQSSLDRTGLRELMAQPADEGDGHGWEAIAAGRARGGDKSSRPTFDDQGSVICDLLPSSEQQVQENRSDD